MSWDATAKAYCDADDFHAAATLIIDRLGGELQGFLRRRLRDDDQTAEVYSVVLERLWRGLPAFRWQSSPRTWVYTVARNALYDNRNAARRRAQRETAVGEDVGRLPAPEADVAFDRSVEADGALARLLSDLPAADRELVQRRASGDAYLDIVKATFGPCEPKQRAQLAGRLRKRYERLLSRLRASAQTLCYA